MAAATPEVKSSSDFKGSNPRSLPACAWERVYQVSGQQGAWGEHIVGKESSLSPCGYTYTFIVNKSSHLSGHVSSHKNHRQSCAKRSPSLR